MARRRVKTAAKLYRVYVPGPEMFFLTFKVRGEFGLSLYHLPSPQQGPPRTEEFYGPLQEALVGATSCQPAIEVKKSELSQLRTLADNGVFEVVNGKILLLSPLCIITAAEGPDVVVYDPWLNPKLSHDAAQWLEDTQTWCVDAVRSAPLIRPEFTQQPNSYVN